uniref:Uncharacterized protein n=1 Tax=Zea mays TaxID=4577 RepID=B6TZV2_MAIZE|nr:hypothetical protein [Zea mays]
MVVVCILKQVPKLADMKRFRLYIIPIFSHVIYISGLHLQDN